MSDTHNKKHQINMSMTVAQHIPMLANIPGISRELRAQKALIDELYEDNYNESVAQIKLFHENMANLAKTNPQLHAELQQQAAILTADTQSLLIRMPNPVLTAAYSTANLAEKYGELDSLNKTYRNLNQALVEGVVPESELEPPQSVSPDLENINNTANSIIHQIAATLVNVGVSCLRYVGNYFLDNSSINQRIASDVSTIEKTVTDNYAQVGLFGNAPAQEQQDNASRIDNVLVAISLSC
jgi:hypothetical protein